MDEAVVESREVFCGRILRVRVDRVKLPGGAEGWREVVAHPGSVAVVATPTPDQVYLVEQYRHAAGRRLWELPAGRLEAGEDPRAAAARELDEEVNLLAQRLVPLLAVYSSPGFTDELTRIYHASGLTPGSGRGGDETTLRAKLWHVPEVLTMIEHGEIIDAKTVAGVTFYALHAGKGGPARAPREGARRTPGEDPILA
jgi:ADP-ribose pyrophosphatase